MDLVVSHKVESDRHGLRHVVYTIIIVQSCQGLTELWITLSVIAVGRSLHDLSGSPVRIARKRIGKTVEGAAAEAGIHWQAWYLTECGVYNDVPPAIDEYFYQRGYILIGSEYNEFRCRNQRDFGLLYLVNKGLPPVDNSVSPMTSYREWVGCRSRSFFAKGLCVQPAVLYLLELGKCKTLPGQLRSALLIAGVSEEDVDELDSRTEDYYGTK